MRYTFPMVTEEDEIRRQARKRLEARMEREGRVSASTQSVRPRAPLFIVVGVVVVLICVIVFSLTMCSNGAGKEPSTQNQAQSGAAAVSSASGQAESSGGTEGQSSTAAESDEPKRDELVSIIGEEEAEKLMAQVQSSEDARWIAAHPDVFAFDGPEVQAKVLKLAADDPLALSFVRNFPDQYSQESPSADESLALSVDSPSANVSSTSVPHLYQWDRRWGYTVYNADAFGLSGCGPTSLAMVYQALTGKADRTPYDMGQLAYEGNYVVEWLGTANDFFTESAGQLGLKCETIEPDVKAITDTLKSGKPIVANLGVGTFTSYGHFFVLAGVADNGEIIVNDPYSATRSSQTWDPQVIASESVALYAYSLANE